MKSRNALLSEIEGLEAELRLMTQSRDEYARDVRILSEGLKFKEAEITWLKRIVVNLSERPA